MRGRNQECVAWTPPIYFGSASMDCGPICGRSWEDSCVDFWICSCAANGVHGRSTSAEKSSTAQGASLDNAMGAWWELPVLSVPQVGPGSWVCRFTQMIKKPEVMKFIEIR